ncbi:MAG: hypothetical protein VZQ61_03425 [Christensenellaceae bacterium]
MYSLQLKKIYSQIINRKDKIGQIIKGVILSFEDENYYECGKQLLELVTSKIENLKTTFDYYINNGDEIKQIEYYIETAKKVLAYWDKINNPNKISIFEFNVVDFKADVPLHVITKKDCVGLLLYFSERAKHN